MNTLKFAILGSSSHIAKNIIVYLLKRGAGDIHLFTRSVDSVSSFLVDADNPCETSVFVHDGYANFNSRPYDVIINCVGVGTLQKLHFDFSQYFTVGEEFDNLVINHLLTVCPSALYICFSSGSVYGRDHAGPVDENTCNSISVNHVMREDYYGITRLYAEAKHRALQELNIVDLRIFSFFSRYIDLTDGYFITEILAAILNDTTLITDNSDMVRDYLHPEDLMAMIETCLKTGRINAAYDVVSVWPASKADILELFSREYGLKYEVCDTFSHISATGSKNYYTSRYGAATALGYVPQFASLETLRSEAGEILSRNRAGCDMPQP
jgi:nucleoside-diphosphate-sugar epimerase